MLPGPLLPRPARPRPVRSHGMVGMASSVATGRLRWRRWPRPRSGAAGGEVPGSARQWWVLDFWGVSHFHGIIFSLFFSFFLEGVFVAQWPDPLVPQNFPGSPYACAIEEYRGENESSRLR